jgi:transglutaminase/protease-like cytokinesis protein 3
MVWGALYTVECIKSYKSLHQMDLNMDISDIIKVFGTESALWVCGKNTTTNEFGSFPLNITKPIKDLDSSINYSLADAHARASSSRDEESISSLSQYLQSVSPIKEMQLRAVFIWICEHIEYDFPAFQSGNMGPQDAKSVLRNRQSVCQGYAELMVALGSGLDVELVSGYGKGAGSQAGAEVIPEKADGGISNHAWNALQLNDGRYYFLECTWGAGLCSNILIAKGYGQNGQFVKRLEERYFLVPPERHIYSHFPSVCSLLESNSFTGFSKAIS